MIGVNIMRDFVQESLRGRTLVHQLNQKLKAIETLQSQNDELVERLMDSYTPMSHTLGMFAEYLTILKQQVEASEIEPPLEMPELNIEQLTTDMPSAPALPYDVVKMRQEYIEQINAETSSIYDLFDDLNPDSLYQKINDLARDTQEFNELLERQKDKIQQNVEQAMVNLEALQLIANYIQHRSLEKIEQRRNIQLIIEYIVNHLSLIPYTTHSVVYNLSEDFTTTQWRKELDSIGSQFEAKVVEITVDVESDDSDGADSSNEGRDVSESLVEEPTYEESHRKKHGRTIFSLFSGGGTHGVK